MIWRGSDNGFDGAGVRVRSTRTRLAMAVWLLIGCGALSAVSAQMEPPPDGLPGDSRMDEAAARQAAAEEAPPTTFLSGAVYLLCAGTSCICAVLLLRGYSKNAVRLLFWSGLCFIGLALDNAMLYIDLVVVPDVNIAIWRRVPALAALTLLIYGLIWDSK